MSWASTDDEIDAAFETVAQQRVTALAVAADPFFDTRRCFHRGSSEAMWAHGSD